LPDRLIFPNFDHGYRCFLAKFWQTFFMENIPARKLANPFAAFFETANNVVTIHDGQQGGPQSARQFLAKSNESSSG
jgi:hypothetical protein